jgi:hypothetical protein
VDEQPLLSFVGSGDFHHVSLALARRLARPFHLLVIDNHPDWMRGIPFLHCGTWLWHALRLPLVRRVFHVGGDVDFDNYYRWLAPWRLLRSGRLTVFPAIRRYRRWPWPGIPTPPLRCQPDTPLSVERIEELLQPFRAELADYPLYVSLDKDVMTTADAVVNWDSGHLHLKEVQTVLAAFGRAAGGLAGMDIVGDWSPVCVSGVLRRFLHWTEHPRLAIDAVEAARCNARTNLALLSGSLLGPLLATVGGLAL